MLTMHSQTWFSRHVVPGLKMKKIYICVLNTQPSWNVSL